MQLGIFAQAVMALLPFTTLVHPAAVPNKAAINVRENDLHSEEISVVDTACIHVLPTWHPKYAVKVAETNHLCPPGHLDRSSSTADHTNSIKHIAARFAPPGLGLKSSPQTAMTYSTLASQRQADSTTIDLARRKVTGHTQAASDIFTTAPFPTGPEPTWHANAVETNLTTPFNTATAPSRQIPTSPQHTSDQGNRTKQPYTTTTEAPSMKGDRLEAFKQDSTDLFTTAPFPTGPEPSWKREAGHTQAATDIFTTAPFPTGPEPTWWS